MWQLAREDLATLTPAEINEARRSGRLDSILRGTPTIPNPADAANPDANTN